MKKQKKVEKAVTSWGPRTMGIMVYVPPEWREFLIRRGEKFSHAAGLGGGVGNFIADLIRREMVKNEK